MVPNIRIIVWALSCSVQVGVALLPMLGTKRSTARSSATSWRAAGAWQGSASAIIKPNAIEAVPSMNGFHKSSASALRAAGAWHGNASAISEPNAIEAVPSMYGLPKSSGRSNVPRMVGPDVVDAHAAVQSQQALGPQAPPPEVLAGLISTVGLSAGAYGYWDKVIVPQKRAEVAASKRKGEIKEYLEDIRGDDERKAEQWLFTDWLEPNKEKTPAVPFLPKKKFNSGDNPVIAAAGLIVGLGIVSGILSQLGSK